MVLYQSSNNPYNNMFLTKINCNGQLIWTIPINFGTAITDMELINSNELLLTGNKSDSLWIAKLDSIGALIWQSTSIEGYHATPNDMKIKADSVFITGTRNDSMFISKYLIDGNFQWFFVYPKLGHDIIEGISCDQLSDGKIVIGVNVGDWMDDYVDRKVGIYKLSPAGDYLSLYIYDDTGSNTETVAKIAVTSSNRVVILGNILLGPIGFKDAFIKNITSSGSEMWSHEYGSTWLDYVYDLQIHESGYIFVSGYIYGRDFWVFKCDSYGNVVWNFSMGGNPWESASSLAIIDEDNVVFAGYAQEQDTLNTQVIVAKLHQTTVDVKDQEQGDFYIPNSSYINNYPNPFNNSTTIEFYVPSNSDVKLYIYNSLGQKVASLVDKQYAKGIYNVIWTTNNLASGIYYCLLKTNMSIKTRKIILIK